MRKKRRNGRVTTETSVEDEIVHLRGLDLKGLRARWRSVLQRPAPDHLPRHLLFAIIAYRIQADRIGDLDHETRQLLDRTGATESGAAMSARLVSFDQKRTELTPGTVLVREWDRQSQRVMVMSERVCLEWPDLRQPFQGRLCHHRHQLEWTALLWLERQRGTVGHG
jgi:hypothetical protein